MTRRWLPEHRHAELRGLATRSRQVVLLSAAVGALTGLVVAGFERLVVEVLFDAVVAQPRWLIACCPAVGLLVAYAIRRLVGAGVSSATADEYVQSFHQSGRHLRWRHVVARIAAAIATLGSGVPMGLEGPSLYIGASVGADAQRRFKRSFRGADRRTLMVAGAAAGVAAIFKAPATGAVFALEVPYRGGLARRMLLPALVASASGYLAFAAVNGTEALFPLEGDLGFRFRDLLGAAILGVVSGVGARGFGWMIRRAKRIASSSHGLAAAAVAGGVIAVAFALGVALTDQTLVVGSGYEAIAWAADPSHSAPVLLAVFVLRCVATSAAVAGGGVGGLFIPLVVGGALIGALVAELVGSPDLELFVVVGVAAFLGSGYRVPLASVMFVAETTGRPSFVVPALIAAVAGELVMGPASVTTYQVDAEHAGSDNTSPDVPAL